MKKTYQTFYLKHKEWNKILKFVIRKNDYCVLISSSIIFRRNWYQLEKTNNIETARKWWKNSISKGYRRIEI